MKYILKMVETDFYGKDTDNETTTSFYADDLVTVLEKTEMFLRGCGFVVDGTLDIIPQEESYSDHGGGSTLEDYPEIKAEILAQKHSHHYFDTERNK